MRLLRWLWAAPLVVIVAALVGDLAAYARMPAPQPIPADALAEPLAPIFPGQERALTLPEGDRTFAAVEVALATYLRSPRVTISVCAGGACELTERRLGDNAPVALRLPAGVRGGAVTLRLERIEGGDAIALWGRDGVPFVQGLPPANLGHELERARALAVREGIDGFALRAVLFVLLLAFAFAAPSYFAREGRSAPWRAALLVASLALVRSAFLSAILPPDVAPDEPVHLDYALRLAEHRQLPSIYTDPSGATCRPCSPEQVALVYAAFAAYYGEWTGSSFVKRGPPPPLEDTVLPDPHDAQNRATQACGQTAYYPPLYYLTAALGPALHREAPLLVRVAAARLASWFWGIAAALAAVALGVGLFGGARDGLLLGLLVVLQPMQAMQASVVTNDAALFACSAGCLAALAWLDKRPRGALLALAACAVLGALAKPSFAMFLPVFALLAAGLGRARATIALVPAALAAGAWAHYARGAKRLLISGEPSSVGIGEYVRDLVVEPGRVFALWGKSYWAIWGAHDIVLSDGYYYGVWLLLALAGIGFVIGRSDLRAFVVAGVAASAVAMLTLYVTEYALLRQTGKLLLQGRYLGPFFSLHAALIVIGLRRLGARAGLRFDLGWIAVPILAVLLTGASLAALHRYYA
jgi:hypothetical protein